MKRIPLSIFLRGGLLLLFIILLTFTLNARGSQEESEESLLLAVLVKRGDQLQYRTQAEGFADRCRELGVESLIMDNAMDLNITLANMDIAIEKGVDGIAVMVPDQKMSSLVVNRAFAVHLPIISLENKLIDPQGRQLAPHFGIDDEDAGYRIGVRLARILLDKNWLLDPSVSMGIVSLRNPGVQEYYQRVYSCKRALVEWLPAWDDSLYYSIEYPHADSVGGMLAMQELLSFHPEITHWVVFSPNAEGVQGAYYALSQLGLESHSLVAQIQNFRSNPHSFLEGIDRVVAYFDPYEQGRAAAEALFYNIRDGKPISPLQSQGCELVETRGE